MELLAFLLILWCVYVSDAVWWTASDRIILSGSRFGEFQARRGPSLELREGKGFAAASLLPPFHYTFECDLHRGSESRTPILKHAHIERLATQALSAAAPLRMLGQGLWIYLFAVTPLTIALFGLLPTWRPLLAILVVWVITIVVMYRRAWRRLYEARPSAWTSDAALMVLSPPGAIGAADRLTRHALAAVGGIRATSVIASPHEFCRIARLIYFDHESVASDAVKREIDEILDGRRLREIFDAAPAPEPGMTGFCHRCHAQVMRDSGGCPDCVGLAITPFRPIA